jgi:prevent-host-death family protein
MIVNIHAAKTNLSKLIQRAEAGEEIIIARNGAPAVRLAPVDAVPVDAVPADAVPADRIHTVVEAGGLPSWVGSLRGQIWIAPGSETPDDDLTREMEDSPIFPPDDGT